MEQVKRKRGRPKGASRLNPEDDQTLIKVAGILEAEAIPASTAMHRLGFSTETAALRRLQRKWKGRREWYVTEARAQAATRAEAARIASARAWPSMAEIQRLATQFDAVSRAISPKLLQAIQGMAAFSDRINQLVTPGWVEKMAVLGRQTAKAWQTYDTRHLRLSSPASDKWHADMTRLSHLYEEPGAALTRKLSG